MSLANGVDAETKNQFLYWYLVAIAHFNLKQFHAASDAFKHAKYLNPQQPQIALKLAESYLHSAHFVEAYAELADIAASNIQLLPKDWFKLGLLHHQLNQEFAAEACFKQATLAEPDNLEFAFNHALTLKNCGALAQAKIILKRIIALQPWHIDALEALILLGEHRSNQDAGMQYQAHLTELLRSQAPVDDIKVHFAMAKMLENAGDYAGAFQRLQLGNRARRKRLKYDVSGDVNMMQQLASYFDAKAPVSEIQSKRPIFIVGLPRSGSTLVERILTQPDNVTSAGELLHFSALLARTVRERFPGRHDQEASKVQESFVQLAAQCPSDELGKHYLAATDPLAQNCEYLVDKMPLNFLNIGLIRRALPHAKIIYMQRNPMDNVLAIYKTLFEQAYPYAYALEDVARYLVGERQLLAHWQQQYPQHLFTVQYESLVKHPETVSTALFNFCGMPFKSAYLRLSDNRSAAATASASQVRSEIYQTSIEKWRQFEDFLTPAINVLRNNGLI